MQASNVEVYYRNGRAELGVTINLSTEYLEVADAEKLVAQLERQIKVAKSLYPASHSSR